jgi:hypothetical protein
VWVWLWLCVQAALDALSNTTVPLVEMLRRICGLSNPVVAAPAEGSGSGGVGGGGGGGGFFARSTSTKLRPVASYTRDPVSVLVRLHDGQLTGILG